MRHLSLITVMALAILCSCENNSMEYTDAVAAVADSTTFASDISTLNAPSRKRIRSATIRCRVTDVLDASNQIEKMTRSVDGVVAESDFSNTASDYHEYASGSDSLKKIHLYTPVSTLTLRIPVSKLDSVATLISSLANHIEYRNMKDTDATFTYLSNALKNEAELQVKPIRPQPKNTVESAVHEEERRTKITDRRIENLEILDNVAYSTFTVYLYEPLKADTYMTVNPVTITRAGFGSEISQALRNGSEWMRSILIGLVEAWPLLLLAAAFIMLVRRWKKLSFHPARNNNP